MALRLDGKEFVRSPTRRLNRATFKVDEGRPAVRFVIEKEGGRFYLVRQRDCLKTPLTGRRPPIAEVQAAFRKLGGW